MAGTRVRGVRRTAGVRRDVEHKISDKVRSNRQRHEHSEDERLDRVRTHARREPGVTGVAQAALRRVKRGLALHVELSAERRVADRFATQGIPTVRAAVAEGRRCSWVSIA